MSTFNVDNSIFKMYHSEMSRKAFCNLSIHHNYKNNTINTCLFKCYKCKNNRSHICKNCGRMNHHLTKFCPIISNSCIFNCNKCISNNPHICENCGRINSHLSIYCPLLIINCKCVDCNYIQYHICRNCLKKNVHGKDDCTFIFCYFCNTFDDHRTFECSKMQEIYTLTYQVPTIELNEYYELSKLTIDDINSDELNNLLDNL